MRRGGCGTGKLTRIKAALSANAALVYSDLVAFWLREEPSEDMEAFAEQAARAQVMEERYMNKLAESLARVLAKLFEG